MKALFLLILGILVGATGAIVVQSPKLVSPSPPVTPELRKKLQDLTEQDLEDYYRLKSAEEKYKKADEILGKIIQIFLADIGLRVSDHARRLSLEPSVPLAAISDSRDRKATPPPPLAPAMPTEEETPRRTTFFSERKLLQARDDSTIDSALRDLRLSHAATEFAKTNIFSNRNDSLRVLNGSFAGAASLTLAGSPHLWDVTVEIASSMVKGTLTGSTKVALAENGKVFSSSHDNGNPRMLREFSAGSSALLLKAAPNVQIQLYYLPDLDMLAGNVYRRDQEESAFNYAGTVKLRRQ